MNTVGESYRQLYADAHCSLQVASIQNKHRKQSIHRQRLSDQPQFIQKVLRISLVNKMDYHPSVLRKHPLL